MAKPMAKPNTNHAYTGLEIAIIGMAGSFPGAGDLQTFWENLEQGVESISFFSREELIEAGHSPEETEHPDFVKALAIMEGKEYFDSEFFSYLDEDARLMDPQMRVFHQTVWTALEDAGYNPDIFPGQIGLYAGAGSSLNWEAYVMAQAVRQGIDGFYAGQLRDKDFMPLRIAYKLNLKGPSVFVKTACSTALVAVHMACRALLTGDCHMAVAGGVSVKNRFKGGYVYREGMITSPDGHCRTFDVKAKGTVSGEGTAAVVLKKLKAAISDKDNIHAVIKGTAVNNDGVRKVGFTAPSLDGQAEAIRMAHKMARIQADTISYIEANGTGTALGDSVEIGALKQVFGPSQEKYCALGSVKSNIGHLDEAAGGAGLIKAVLALKHKKLPPSLHFTAPGPGMAIDDSPFYINNRVLPWISDRSPLRAGVSAFGIGGNNAHIILEEAPQPGSVPSADYYLFVLSARNEQALERMKGNVKEYFKRNPAISPANAAYTLQIGRKAFANRCYWVCKNIAEAIEALSQPDRFINHGTIDRSGHGQQETFVRPAAQPGTRGFLEGTGAQWLKGVTVDWRELYGDTPPGRASLPAYPFEKTVYPVAVDAFRILSGDLKDPLTGTQDPPAIQPRPELDTPYAEPSTGIETQLAAVWQDVLNIEHAGSGDNFFSLGGQSLKATQVVNKIRKRLDVPLQLTDIFTYPTIASLAAAIEEKSKQRFQAIPVSEKRSYYPLSPAQTRLFTLYNLGKRNIAYNMPLVYTMTGNVDKDAIQRAALQLIERHESFRTGFCFVDDIPVQRVGDMAELSFSIEYEELDSVDDDMIHAFVRPFDLSHPPLLRVCLVRTGVNQYVFMVDTHHIISDGVTHAILVNDFMSLYTGAPVLELPLQYKDYSVWLTRAHIQARLKQQETYWLKQFSGDLPILNLPVDFARPHVQSFDGHRAVFSLSEEQTAALKSILKQDGITLFILLLTVLNITLHKITAQEDIVVGTGAAGRRHEDLASIAGLFVNTLALRSRPQPDKSFESFLAEVKKSTLDAFENQEYPFETLVEKVNASRDTSRNPIFDVMLVLQNIDTRPRPLPGWDLSLELFEYDIPISKFDITVFAEESGNCLVFTLEYSTALFSAQTMEIFKRYFLETVGLAKPAASQPSGLTIAQMTQIPADRKAEIIRSMNQELDEEVIAIDVQAKPLQSRLNDAFLRFADNIAIQSGRETVTYSELQRRSFFAAKWLVQANGAETGVFVAVMMDDRVHLITALIAILSARAVFIPLDSSLPDERLKLMLQTTGAQTVWCGQESRLRLQRILEHETPAPQLITWDDLMSLASTDTGPDKNKNKNNDKNNTDSAVLAGYDLEDHVYIYFTSGSTGTPRAILGRNTGVMHFIDWEIRTFDIDRHYRFSQLISPVFDAFLRDVLTPLCSGARICIPADKDTSADPVRLGDWLEQSGINLVHTVPGIFRILIAASGGNSQRFPSLRFILLSGERINPADLARWYQAVGERVAIVNLWGTSETTLVKTFHFVSPKDARRERVPVGKPLPGTRVAVLNPDLELCDTLVNGELYIKTPYRTAGYYRDDAANEQRFMAAPFDGSADELHRLHKTGDLGRILADGSIDVLGRNDRQIKIRGMRVELEEIESVAAGHSDVSEAAVLKKVTPGGNDILCAYVVLHADAGHPEDPSSAEEDNHALEKSIRRFLEQRLPSYMVPAHIILLDTFPRRASGKIDYLALPEPLIGQDEESSPSSRTQPADDIEKQLLAMWSAVLGLASNTISMDSDFFKLGGHSINAVTLNARIQRQFDVPMEPGQIFNNPTIETQAVIIRQYLSERGGDAHHRNEKYMSIAPAEKRAYYPLSPSQKRLYILHRMDPNAVNYNMFNMVSLDGHYDVARLDDVCRHLIRRHEGLRTSFHMRGKFPVQRVHDNDIVNFIFEYDNVEGLSLENGEAGHTEVVRNFIRPFDLSRAPLFRAGLVKVQEEKFILLVDFHHIISDGMSHDIFVSEALHLYARPDTPLPQLKLQYKDYAVWLYERMESGEMDRQEHYWLDQFKEESRPLNLPLDFPRPRLQDYEGRTMPFIIPRAQADVLRHLARREGATMFMVVLALLQVFLSRLTGQTDIIVGTVSVGRGHRDLERIIGMFVNTLVLRGYPSTGKTFIQLVREARDTTRGAFAHQEYPFEDLVEKLVKKRETGRNPLFDVMYSFTAHQPGQPVPPPAQANDRPAHAKFDLQVSGGDTGDYIQMAMGYRTSLFKPETMERFCHYFKEIAAEAAHNEHLRMEEFEVSNRLSEAGSTNFESEDSEFDF